MSHAVGVAAAAATAAVLGIVSQELRTAKVAGSSMAPTFQTGSSILIERVSLFLGAVCHAALPLTGFFFPDALPEAAVPKSSKRRSQLFSRANR